MRGTYPFGIKWVLALLEENRELLRVARAARQVVNESSPLKQKRQELREALKEVEGLL